MDEIKRTLIEKAKEEYGHIRPIRGKLGQHMSLNDCFTLHDGKLLFWFNTSDDTTRMLIKEVVNGSN